MSRFVLDSSTVLAPLDEEPGAEQVADLIGESYVSTINLAEVYSKLAERGPDPRQPIAYFKAAVGGIVPFTDEMALVAGELRPCTRHHGLSLGDRACLATAVVLDVIVYTADRAWAADCEIRFIRP